ncbi:patatin [Halothiobacillus diazotrophicus]|uniref:Patatin n=1 Tax=Halothiobacillus diazotrophicus TaxID=1860122 RepID=A0A191ZEB6_9GAMM|nr:patatin-like phospholipase family protein [Halothiobacillus diazotrophicus]ANJ66205.1 patatin [Halothiobacillus diazotrophicus]
MKIGLALGSGAARGWAHIGVIRELARLGIEPDIITGTSIGSLVGAAYVSGNLDRLESWVCSLGKLETAKFFNINMSLNGFVNRDKLHRFLNEYVAQEDVLIEHIEAHRYAAVATELETGKEIWLNQGSLLEAVWASISLPGLFPAIRNQDRWLIDGGVVNPVPVSVCRALGADLVIAVNLNSHIVGKPFETNGGSSDDVIGEARSESSGIVGRISDVVREYTTALFPNNSKAEKEQPPSLFDAIAGAVNITQDRITRSRMAGDPPDVILSPKIAHIGLLEFYRADEAIQEGGHCVQRMGLEIKHLLRRD